MLRVIAVSLLAAALLIFVIEMSRNAGAARPQLKHTILVTDAGTFPEHCTIGRNDSVQWLNARNEPLHVFFKAPGVDSPNTFNGFAGPREWTHGFEFNLGTVRRKPYYIAPNSDTAAGFVSTTDALRSCDNTLRRRAVMPALASDQQPHRGAP